MIHIDISNPHQLKTPSLSNLEDWATLTLQKCQQSKANIALNIADEAEIQTLNHQYRQKDKPTNILSFPFERPPGLLLDEQEFSYFLGDLIICPSIVEKEACLQKKVLEHHWCHILIHGILHLLGYDHIDEADAIVMEGIEIKLLQQLNISNPYQEHE